MDGRLRVGVAGDVTVALNTLCRIMISASSASSTTMIPRSRSNQTGVLGDGKKIPTAASIASSRPPALSLSDSQCTKIGRHPGGLRETPRPAAAGQNRDSSLPGRQGKASPTLKNAWGFINGRWISDFSRVAPDIGPVPSEAGRTGTPP